MLRAGEPSLHVKQDPTVSKTLAQSQQGWQAVIDHTLSNVRRPRPRPGLIFLAPLLT